MLFRQKIIKKIFKRLHAIHFQHSFIAFVDKKLLRKLSIPLLNYFFPEILITCNFSSLFVFDELLFELLFVCKGEPGAIQEGAETSRSQ